MSKGPVLIDLDGDAAPHVAEAPPVPDESTPHEGRAMLAAAHIAARKPSRLARWFWSLLLALLGAGVSLAAWDFLTGLIARNPTLGYGFTALLGLFLLVCLIIALREIGAIGRLSRIDHLRHAAAQARDAADLTEARRVTDQITRLYRARPETKWARERLAELRGDQLDAGGLLDLTEQELVSPLDALAEKEIEAAARQVATVTALVPLALADVVAALTANLRMIRRIAEIYGGRSGLIGGWRPSPAARAPPVAAGAGAGGGGLC